MKPSKKHFIPFVGMFTYYKEYFKGDYRTEADALQALKVQTYHWFIGVVIMISLIFVMLNFF